MQPLDPSILREYDIRGVVGEPVEEARRIESLTTRTGAKVLISAATRKELPAEGRFESRRIEGVSTADGNAIEVYELVAI